MFFSGNPDRDLQPSNQQAGYSIHSSAIMDDELIYIAVFLSKIYIALFKKRNIYSSYVYRHIFFR